MTKIKGYGVDAHPRRLSATIAPIPPPSTAEIIAEKRSRVSIEDMDTTIEYTWT
jgi:TRAP-type C4-dicarboxylate transport system permease large subunit